MSKYINEDHSRSRYMVSENKTDVKTLRQDGLGEWTQNFMLIWVEKNLSEEVTFELILDNKMSGCMKNQSNMNTLVYNLFGPNPAVGSVGDHSEGTGSKKRTMVYLCSPETSPRICHDYGD